MRSLYFLSFQRFCYLALLGDVGDEWERKKIMCLLHHFLHVLINVENLLYYVGFYVSHPYWNAEQRT